MEPREGLQDLMGPLYNIDNKHNYNVIQVSKGPQIDRVRPLVGRTRQYTNERYYVPHKPYFSIEQLFYVYIQ